MSLSGPVLISNKTEWNSILDQPVIGKDVLELLSSSMYINALAIYREYVQNSADAIEEAIGLGLLDAGKGRIDIVLDPVKRAVRIRDNGTGLSKSCFARTLVALGASRKRGTKARGFRGVGRLAGLGYCQELIFRSRADGEKEISELIWDCRRLKAALKDGSFTGTAEDLIRGAVRVRTFLSSESPERFFEVELASIVRHGDDSLISVNRIRDYLSQVAPVPFNPEFRFARVIQDRLRGFGIGNVLIHINDGANPIYRPFQNAFEVRKGLIDAFSDLKFFELKGDDNNPIAVSWLLHHSYRGAIDDKTLIKGLRLRTGNIQIGEYDVLDHLFSETRFNSWCVGEIHVLDPRILPNGRRDHFEQSVRFNDLLNRLAPLARKISRLCRHHSLRRNTLRQFQAARMRVQQNLSVVLQGAIGSTERKRLGEEVSKHIIRMGKVREHPSLDTLDKERLALKLARAKEQVERALSRNITHRALDRLHGRERRSVERLISLIYECSPNKPAAKLLVDRILDRV